MTEGGDRMILKRERRGAVEILTLDRPEVRNAFDAALSVALYDALSELDGDDDVRACLLNLLDTRRFRLRQVVIGALGALDDERVRRPLEALYRRTVFPRERRKLEQILDLGP